MPEKKWEISQPNKEAAMVLRHAGFSRITAALLALRGFSDEQAAKSFVQCDGKLCDPMLLKDMEKAAKRIIKAIDANEKITVYGDYDADGVTATALLYSYLKENGADVDYYIPDRESEGYGLNKTAAEKIIMSGTKLVVSVDTGISAFDEAKQLEKFGVDFIVTDHHEPRDTIPLAFAVVNPKQPDCRYPFKELAGVGVAFKLVCALEQSRMNGMSGHAAFIKYGELVCLGTVADVVPLTDENRLFVKNGLELINSSATTGIGALLEAAGAHNHRLSSTTLSFTAAPRINACGRISNAADALELLITHDAKKAEELAKKLNENNNERKKIESQILKEAREKIDGNEALRNSPILIVSGDGWHCGVIGIVASRLVELYSKPAIVVSFEDDEGRASCRSIAGFNIHKALMACSEYLERFGGHELAAGFSVRRENYDALYAALIHIANALPEPPSLKIKPEMRLHGKEISLSTAREIRRLEPFGCGNPTPLFYIPSVQITALSPVGNGHMRMMLSCEGFGFSAIMFGAVSKGFDYKVSDIVDIAAELDVNIYKNNETLSVIVRNIRKSACFSYYDGLYSTFASGEQVEPVTLRLRLKPSRAEFAAVYRLLYSGGGKVNLESICKSLTRRDVHFNYFKLLLIIGVFSETGLLKLESKTDADKISYSIIKNKKVDLAKSSLLKRIG